MPFIQFNDSLRVGFEEIDNDHKQLIEIINMLDDAISAGNEQNVVSEILNELISYTLWHFRHEERLMQTHGDPTLFDHKKEHDNLVKEVSERQKAFLEGEPGIATKLMPFLKNWLIKHILVTDKKTAKFLAGLSK